MFNPDISQAPRNQYVLLNVAGIGVVKGAYRVRYQKWLVMVPPSHPQELGLGRVAVVAVPHEDLLGWMPLPKAGEPEGVTYVC